MKEAFKKRFKKLIFWLIIIFALLFVFRLMYGYTITVDNSPSDTRFFEDSNNSKSNYASKEYSMKGGNQTQASIKVDQKYEKIAEIKTKSTKFEAEEKSSRTEIEKYNALIQFEQKSGNKGHRKLNLVIGVPPENFDSLYSQLIKIGNVQAKQITKKDKTNEYKELNARKNSLEKIRNSLIDLKSKNGKIEEFMDLENRILDIEQQLQGLGVSLGDFSDDNEFFTVKFSLLEGQEVTISFMHRLKVALEWTIKTYLRIVSTLFFITLFAYVILLGIDKLKILSRIITRKD